MKNNNERLGRHCYNRENLTKSEIIEEDSGSKPVQLEPLAPKEAASVKMVKRMVKIGIRL